VNVTKSHYATWVALDVRMKCAASLNIAIFPVTFFLGDKPLPDCLDRYKNEAN